MATGKEYLNFILDQLSGLDGITYRQMMGEYMIYYRGKLAAYLCDDRLLVKPLPSALVDMSYMFSGCTKLCNLNTSVLEACKGDKENMFSDSALQ